MSLPVALTAGEPAGIGLELALKAWREIGENRPFFLIADHGHVKAAAGDGTPIVKIKSPPETPLACKSGLPVLHHEFPAPNAPGRPNLANADAVVAVIRRAVDLVMKGHAAAVCTNPIHKKALKDGTDFPYPGHTEFLAELGNVSRSIMMLAAPELRVVPVTIHIALKDVPKSLTPDLLADTIQTTNAALITDFGIASPRIAIAGLNPHAGEGGVMGDEEQSVISPVIERLRAGGMSITDPMSADTMFHTTAREKYDVAICMYHDQALIPLKTLNFSGGVNITLGLPFVRTSPDHGTAFNIAGKGIADPESLIAAIYQAHDIAQCRLSRS